MYHAQEQAASFTNLMDFSDNSWSLYAKHRENPELATMSSAERIDYLKKQHLFDDYFNYLKHEAYGIGESIKNHVRALKPDIQIGAYCMTLPGTWFLQGFLSGLSSPVHPIILATFNNEVAQHRAWLAQQNIYCYHLTPILLSKFKSLTDFGIVDELLSHHDGIWLNKFNRLIQSRDAKKWEWGWGLEVSPLPTNVVTRALSDQISAYDSDVLELQ